MTINDNQWQSITLNDIQWQSMISNDNQWQDSQGSGIESCLPLWMGTKWVQISQFPRPTCFLSEAENLSRTLGSDWVELVRNNPFNLGDNDFTSGMVEHVEYVSRFSEEPSLNRWLQVFLLFCFFCCCFLDIYIRTLWSTFARQSGHVARDCWQEEQEQRWPQGKKMMSHWKKKENHYIFIFHDLRIIMSQSMRSATFRSKQTTHSADWNVSTGAEGSMSSGAVATSPPSSFLAWPPLSANFHVLICFS